LPPAPPEAQPAGHRHARLEHLLYEELDALLRDELYDPALEEVRFLGVDLSVDYRNARVRFALSPGQAAKREAAERALSRATPFLKGRLAEALDLKFVPALRFVYSPLAPGSDLTLEE
jgi:ribosome-binding factor A